MRPSLRGHFLLAAPTLKDPNFLRSVILMVKHDTDGAIGVIINAPLDVTVADALGEAVASAAEINVPLHRGGPCEGPMMVLHAAHGGANGGPGDTFVSGSDEVMPGVQFTASRDDIERVMTQAKQAARYIIGYAGWATDQLEREMAEGSWVVLPATPSEIFAETTHELWTKLMGKASLLRFLLPEQIPEDPGLN